MERYIDESFPKPPQCPLPRCFWRKPQLVYHPRGCVILCAVYYISASRTLAFGSPEPGTFAYTECYDVMILEREHRNETARKKNGRFRHLPKTQYRNVRKHKGLFCNNFTRTRSLCFRTYWRPSQRVPGFSYIAQQPGRSSSTIPKLPDCQYEYGIHIRMPSNQRMPVQAECLHAPPRCLKSSAANYGGALE